MEAAIARFKAETIPKDPFAGFEADSSEPNAEGDHPHYPAHSIQSSPNLQPAD
jgi:hypothetical protein